MATRADPLASDEPRIRQQREEGNAFGLRATLSLVTLQAVNGGTLCTWEERYENDDLTTARASFEEGIADIAQQLVARFGGRVVERWMDAPR